MSKTFSTMLSLGTSAPDFFLPDAVSGKIVSLNDFKDKKALLVMFICHHCPYVQHVKKELAQISKDYQYKNIGIVAISANDITAHSDDSPEYLKEMAKDEGFIFAFAYDEIQAVAKAYKAACTPDFFLFDQERKLVYRGQLDDSRPGNYLPVTGKDLRNAIDSLLADKSINSIQKPSLGCNIKWKEGNEPDYFSSGY